MQTLQQLCAGKLQGVTKLTLAEGLTEFPLEILTLAESLEVLDLSNNQLSNLPDSFAQLSRLRVVFLSNNHFSVLPRVLSSCASLEMIGFKSNQITTVPADAFPPKTRWLILTDNRISQLPESLGDCVQLQKLMLAGNALTALPQRIVECQDLQLLRISANDLIVFPDVLLKLPKLAWLAFAGNPFCASLKNDKAAVPKISRDQLVLADILGQGASGVIYRAGCLSAALPATVAVKVFKGEVTSDGFPQDELNACLKLKPHVNLVSPLAYVDDVDGRALVMALIPEGYANLGLPPSLASCTRDTFAEGFVVSAAYIKTLFTQMQAVVASMHAQGFCHGDIYAHNVLHCVKNSDSSVEGREVRGHLLFGDLGAASELSFLSEYQQAALIKIEQRALGYFLADLLSVHAPAQEDESFLLREFENIVAHLTA